MDAGCQLVNVSNYKMVMISWSGFDGNETGVASQNSTENGVINERAEGIASVVLPSGTCHLILVI